MAAYSYTFGVTGIYKVDANMFGEMLEQMERDGVAITPGAVLDMARELDSPIHNEFEWDDTIAAEKYRLEQARKMIVCLKRVDAEEEQKDYKLRAVVSTPGGNNVYVPLQTALGNEEYKAHMLKQAKNDCEIFLAKYRKLEALASVVGAMNEFIHEQKVS